MNSQYASYILLPSASQFLIILNSEYDGLKWGNKIPSLIVEQNKYLLVSFLFKLLQVRNRREYNNVTIVIFQNFDQQQTEELLQYFSLTEYSSLSKILKFA